MAMAEMPGPYDVREYACLSRGVVTNTCPMAPYRGVSRPVITFTIERLMDKAAAAFGLDPIEIRRRNLVRTFPYTSAMGLVFDEATYVETMDAAVKAVDVPAFRARQAKARADGRYLGLGFATFSERTGYGTPAFAARGMEVTPGWETVEMSMDPSGFIEARIGASPHGQGLRTTLSQIIADELGTSPDRIKIVHGDTDRTPYGWGTFASRSLVIAGGATLLAARKVRAKLVTMASMLLEASADDIVLEADVARVTGTDRAIAFATLARAAYHQIHRFKGEITPGIVESATYDPPGTFSNACHVAMVEVDVETGRVVIEKFLVAEDAGRLINPTDRRRADPRRRRARHRQRAAGRDHLRRHRQYPDRDAWRTICRRPRARFRRSRSITWRPGRKRPSPRRRGWAKAARSARRPRSSTPSTTRCRRSACRSTNSRRRRSASARRCARLLRERERLT